MQSHLLPEVIALSRKVGKYLREEQSLIHESDVLFKGQSNNLVSRADKEAERRFVEGLEQLLPKAGFIAEEGTSSMRSDDYNWIVDPLDGTTNYLYGIPCYCTSVGLKWRDELLLGVIYDPMRDECFSAAKGKGAHLNGKPIQVSGQDDLSKALLALGFPYDSRGKMRQYLDLLEKLEGRTRGLRRLGAAALDMAYLACGRFEAFYEYGLNPWDVAAGALIISEAGGKVSDFHGGSDFLFGETVLCSNGKLHEVLLEHLRYWS